MLTKEQAQSATFAQLTDELAAAGWDSTQQTRDEALEAVLQLIDELSSKRRSSPVTIRNINDAFGDPVEFSGETVEAAMAEMQAGIRSCGEDFRDAVVTIDDIEIVSE